MPITVGLLFNLGKNDPPEEGEPPDIHAELDGEKTVLAVAEALRWAGHDVVMIEGDENAYERLRTTKIDIAFNICEGTKGDCRESQIPAILEMLGVPYTGSNVLTLAVSLDKPTTKKIFAFHGVPTPAFRSIAPGEDIDVTGLHFPLFVKPAREGSSMGVSPNSVVRNRQELNEQVSYIHKWYRQEALVEEYLDGREFTIGILGNEEHLVLPIREILFDRCPSEHGRIYSYQFKQEWYQSEYYQCPAQVDEELAKKLRDTAMRAYKAVNCCDVGRVDLRLDRNGVPHVLEINPLPGLSPGFSDLPLAADALGMSFNELVNAILDCALARYGMVHLKKAYAQRTA